MGENQSWPSGSVLTGAFPHSLINQSFHNIYSLPVADNPSVVTKIESHGTCSDPCSCVQYMYTVQSQCMVGSDLSDQDIWRYYGKLGGMSGHIL